MEVEQVELLDLPPLTGEMVLGNPKHPAISIFGTIEVVEGHVVLVPLEVLAVVVMFVEGVSMKASHQRQVMGGHG